MDIILYMNKNLNLKKLLIKATNEYLRYSVNILKILGSNLKDFPNSIMPWSPILFSLLKKIKYKIFSKYNFKKNKNSKF